MCNPRCLRARDAAVIAAVILGIGSPLSLAVNSLFGPSERVSSLLSSHFVLSPDMLTACTMGAFCLTLGIAMLTANYFMRRFLSPESWQR